MYFKCVLCCQEVCLCCTEPRNITSNNNCCLLRSVQISGVRGDVTDIGSSDEQTVNVKRCNAQRMQQELNIMYPLCELLFPFLFLVLVLLLGLWESCCWCLKSSVVLSVKSTNQTLFPWGLTRGSKGFYYRSLVFFSKSNQKIVTLAFVLKTLKRVEA